MWWLHTKRRVLRAVKRKENTSTWDLQKHFPVKTGTQTANLPTTSDLFCTTNKTAAVSLRVAMVVRKKMPMERKTDLRSMWLQFPDGLNNEQLFRCLFCGVFSPAQIYFQRQTQVSSLVCWVNKSPLRTTEAGGVHFVQQPKSARMDCRTSLGRKYFHVVKPEAQPSHHRLPERNSLCVSFSICDQPIRNRIACYVLFYSFCRRNAHRWLATGNQVHST